MRIAVTEDQILRLKLKVNKENLNEDLLDDLISKGSSLIDKGIDAGAQYITGLDTDVVKKSQDIAAKADYVGDNVDDFFKILKDIDTPIAQQNYGSMTRQQAVEAVQIGLQILGYSLPRFGTDGLFGPETANAVNKYKQDKSLNSLNEGSIQAPIALPRGFVSNFGVKRPKHVHNGIDIGARVGTEIKSVADGVVEVASQNYNGMCGAGIIIKHADGFQSGYCHLSKINVAPGDSVTQGQIIGLTGGEVGAPGAGNSNGPHLHFTLRKNGTPTDPTKYFGGSIGEFSMPTTDFVANGAIISLEMVDHLVDDLLSKGVTVDDLKKYIDPAITTGGSVDFTDINLKTTDGQRAYEEICQNFIQKRDPRAKVTGSMMAKSATKVFENYGKYVPPELALAQLTLEGGIGSASNSRPNKTNNPFNVGNVDNGKNKYFPSIDAGVDAYYDLIARRYLVKGRTAANLVQDFVNNDGNRYATAGIYERGLRSLIKTIRRNNEDVYARLNVKSTSSLTESLLNEADKRHTIKNVLGLSGDWAEEFHNLSNKLSIWIADTFIKDLVKRAKNMADQYGDHEDDDPRDAPPSDENELKNVIISKLNAQGPRGTDNWNNGHPSYKSKYEYILHWFRAPRREQINIRDLSLDQAYAMADEWHDNLEVSKQANYKEENDVFIDYRNGDGVGTYWVNLHKNYCEEERERMGHCATSRTGVLISLRRINEFGEGESYLTVDYRPGGVVGDFHRHGNKKPTARFHKQIVDFLINTTYPVNKLTKDGVHRYDENFLLSDLSEADLNRVLENNAALRYNIEDKTTWPQIINGIISGELNVSSFRPNEVLSLLFTSKSNKKVYKQFKSLFDSEMINDFFNDRSLDERSKKLLMAEFGEHIVNSLILKLNNSDEQSRMIVFVDMLRNISQNYFDTYQTFCPLIDHGFTLFPEDSQKVEIVGQRAIKRTILSCTDSVPFLLRFAENTPIDKNGNISVKTEEGLWGLVNKDGQILLHPQFYAVAPNPVDRGRTYLVKNANGDFFSVNLETGQYVKLAKKG